MKLCLCLYRLLAISIVNTNIFDDYVSILCEFGEQQYRIWYTVPVKPWQNRNSKHTKINYVLSFCFIDCLVENAVWCKPGIAGASLVNNKISSNKLHGNLSHCIIYCCGHFIKLFTALRISQRMPENIHT